MAAFFIDLDGTIVDHGTNEVLPGALEMLKDIETKGHQIIFTTRRGSDYPDSHIYGKVSTHRLIRSLGVKPLAIIFDVTSPRIVINDDGAMGITHPRNQPLDYEIGDDKNPIKTCPEKMAGIATG